MKKTRLLTMLVAAVFIVCATASAAGCGGNEGPGNNNKKTDDAQTLEIFISNFGYGYDWIDEEIREFKNQNWVKEKYPDLNIPAPSHNSDREFVPSRIVAGKNANSVDLFFGTNPASQRYHMKDSDGNLFFEDLTDFYESSVPGEDIKIKDKLKKDVVEAQHIERLDDGKRTYYGMPWVDGMMGMVCNETLVRSIKGDDYVMPRTTEELKVLAEDIKNGDIRSSNGKTKASPFISSSKVDYWAHMFIIWWAQYEGIEGYDRFMRCVDAYDQRSNSVFAQKGRLRALQVIDDLINHEHGYNHTAVNTMEFTMAQTKFLLGEGVMMPNGDWIENEMRSIAGKTDDNYKIAFMKMPVISSITEKCDTVKDDAALSSAVRCVDEGKSYDEAKAVVEGLSKADYDRIYEARKVTFKVEGHEAYIPSYATGKELAKDFLRFLATDKGIEVFMRTTNGCSTPYKYDIETKAPDLYNSLSYMQKSRIESAKTNVLIPPVTKYRLVNYGGLGFFTTSNFDAHFTAKNAKDRMSPEEFYNADIEFYTENNFNALLRRAGL